MKSIKVYIILKNRNFDENKIHKGEIGTQNNQNFFLIVRHILYLHSSKIETCYKKWNKLFFSNSAGMCKMHLIQNFLLIIYFQLNRKYLFLLCICKCERPCDYECSHTCCHSKNI